MTAPTDRAEVWEKAARVIADALADQSLTLDQRRALSLVEANLWLAARRDLGLPTENLGQAKEQRA